MCGRINVYGEPLSKAVSSALNIDFQTITNNDLCPTQTASTVTFNNGMHQLDTTWGIKPSWSKKLLINAQSETVAVKQTFKRAFANNRCVVPCSGWYEWSSVAGESKQKYLFDNTDGSPLYMAGIYYPQAEAPPELVTLTTKPTKQCAQYHHRMPMLIPEDAVEDWLRLPVEKLCGLLIGGVDTVKVVRC
jgi:putative SOS response-associated peptidase YedK